MKKRGQVTLFVAIALVLMMSIVLMGLLKKSEPLPKQEENQCQEDSDCVPSSCCHPNSCIQKFNAPNCEGTVCSAECSPNTLDCGQGKCICQFNKCETSLE